MTEHVHTAADVEAWLRYQGSPAGLLRTRLLWHGLRPHLPGTPGRALDVGAGTGEFSARLGHEGYVVVLVDTSAPMLAEAARRLGGREVRAIVGSVGDDRLTLEPESFDLVACHSVIEFVGDRAAVIARLVRALRVGGVLSLAFGNRHQGPLKAAVVQGDFARARRELDGSPETPDCFGRPRRLLDPAEVRAVLAREPLDVLQETGIRIVADLVSPAATEQDPEGLAALEIALMGRPEYRALARYIHVVARKTEP